MQRGSFGAGSQKMTGLEIGDNDTPGEELGRDNILPSVAGAVRVPIGNETVANVTFAGTNCNVERLSSSLLRS